MKFKIETDYQNEGWIFLTFPLFKIHIDTQKTEKELYQLTTAISTKHQTELDALFIGRLSFCNAFLKEIGVNYYMIADRKGRRNNCMIIHSESRGVIN